MNEPLADLLQRCQRGEEAAFEAVVSRFSGRLFKLCYHMLGNRSDAEDLVQETFLTAFTEMRSLRDVRAFSQWITRIATRLCLARLRRPVWVSWLEHLGGGRPDQALEHVETRDALSRALEQLSPPLRAVVLLRDVLDHPYEEIADILQVPEGTVKSRLHAARTQMRGALGGRDKEALSCPAVG